MNDLINRLRMDVHPYQSIKREAADALESQAAEIEAYKKQIKSLIVFRDQQAAEIERLTAELEKEHIYGADQWARAERLQARVDELEARTRVAASLIEPWSRTCDYRAEPDLQEAVHILTCRSANYAQALKKNDG